MSERDAMWREDLTDACRGVRFHLGFIQRAVRGIDSMPSDFTAPCISELAQAETALTEALLAVKLARGELDRKPQRPVMQAAE